MKQLMLSIVAFVLLFTATSTTPTVYRPYKWPQQYHPTPILYKRANAELINGLIGMDLGRLNQMGKRSNAELINGLIGMDLNRLQSLGRRR